MTTLINTAQNPLVRALHRSGLLAERSRLPRRPRLDGDHVLLLRLPEVVAYEAERLVPFISNGPLIWWLYPVFGHAGASYFLGVSEWTFGGSAARGLLGQAARRSGCPRLDRHLHRDGHDHSVHAGRLGRRGRRLPRDDGQRPLPDEGRRSARRLALSPEAGPGSLDAAIIITR